MHVYFSDPKAATETFEDDNFDEDDVAERLAQRRGQSDQLPNDFEPL